MTSGPETPRPRPRRHLNLIDRFVWAPIGLLWLVVLAVLGVPLLISMTLLYWIVQASQSLFGRKGATRSDRSGRQERVA